MFIIYIWFDARDSVGHAAAHIIDAKSRRNAYISWYPTGEDIPVRVAGKAIRGLPDDKRAMQRWPDRVYRLNGLTDYVGIAWWENFSNKKDSTYGLFDFNCAWAVHFALQLCGSEKYVGLGYTNKRLNMAALKFVNVPVNFLIGAFGERQDHLVAAFDGLAPALLTPRELDQYVIAMQNGMKSR